MKKLDFSIQVKSLIFGDIKLDTFCRLNCIWSSKMTDLNSDFILSQEITTRFCVFEGSLSQFNFLYCFLRSESEAWRLPFS